MLKADEGLVGGVFLFAVFVGTVRGYERAEQHGASILDAVEGAPVMCCRNIVAADNFQGRQLQ